MDFYKYLHGNVHGPCEGVDNFTMARVAILHAKLRYLLHGDVGNGRQPNRRIAFYRHSIDIIIFSLYLTKKFHKMFEHCSQIFKPLHELC